jgi:DNA-binding NtrC family response regulator
MTAPGKHEPYSVMVSWLSVNSRASPFLSVLEGSALKPRVEKLYLCWRNAPAPDGDRERSALKETLRELKDRLSPICPQIVLIPWETDASPASHDALRPFVEDVLRRVRAENPEARVVIHMSPGTPAMHAIWLLLGTTGLISDPVELIQTSDRRPGVERIRFSLDTWLRRYRQARPQKAESDDGGQLWDPSSVASPALRDVFAKLSEWAPLRVPVLLLGERGTGKTTFANLLRSCSPFQKEQAGGWPVVVCGQFRVNPHLARSELFGHVRGAFTGATRDRAGLLDAADGDTLFLDEIADIDRDTQRLLIAAVEGRGFSRLGEAKLRHSRFRLVAATNRELDELRGGLLDADFLDRIAVFTLHIPPLRACREDLAHAWATTLRRAVASSGLEGVDWRRFEQTPQLLDHLSAHPLPGNFRDLQRAAFHLLAAVHAGRAESQVLDSVREALGPQASHESPPVALPSEGQIAGILPIASLDDHLDEYHQVWLRAALRRSDGVATRAAELLGLKRKTFEDRAKKLLGD